MAISDERVAAMAKYKRERAVTVLALSPKEAAQALGCSREFFDVHVLGELKVVRRGRRVFVSINELESWLARSAARTTRFS